MWNIASWEIISKAIIVIQTVDNAENPAASIRPYINICFMFLVELILHGVKWLNVCPN